MNFLNWPGGCLWTGELNRKNQEGQPGGQSRLLCNSIIIGSVAVVEKGLINLDNIIIDAKSGVSGAGKSLKEAFL